MPFFYFTLTFTTPCFSLLFSPLSFSDLLSLIIITLTGCQHLCHRRLHVVRHQWRGRAGRVRANHTAFGAVSRQVPRGIRVWKAENERQCVSAREGVTCKSDRNASASASESYSLADSHIPTHRHPIPPIARIPPIPPTPPAADIWTTPTPMQLTRTRTGDLCRAVQEGLL